MTRAATASIDLNALRHNLRQLKAHAPQAKLLAVIKANAYGHGLLRVAKALQEADGLAVAHLEEALELRRAGLSLPVVSLQGMEDAEELAISAAHNLDIVVHHPAQVELLQQTSLPRPLRVWLKVDTGMHRLGLTAEQAEAAFQQLSHSQNVSDIIGMSHLARSDERASEPTQQQLQRFSQLTDAWQVPRSLANSGGLLAYPQTHFDWVRPGIALYGIAPHEGRLGSDFQLQPVMSLKSRLIAVNPLRQGDSVGYGARWTAQRDTTLGVVCIGYGDGYPRHAVDGTPVLVNGRRVPLAGRVSMDMICVDLGPDASDQVGDEVVLWGEQLPIEEIARHADTIAYELTCKLTPRVHLEVLGG